MVGYFARRRAKREEALKRKVYDKIMEPSKDEITSEDGKLYAPRKW